MIAASCRLRVAGCGLRVAGCGLRVAVPQSGISLRSDCGLRMPGVDEEFLTAKAQRRKEFFSRKVAKSQSRKESFSRKDAKAQRGIIVLKSFLTTEDTEVPQRATKRFSCLLAARSSKLAACNLQPVTCNLQPVPCSLQLAALLLFSFPLFISVHFFNFWPRGNRNLFRKFFGNIPVAVFHPIKNVMLNGGKEHPVAPEINNASVC